MAECLCKLNPRKTNPYTITKEETTWESPMNHYRQTFGLAAIIDELRCSEVAEKASALMPLHVQKETTHYNEMNDKISDIDGNAWGIAGNVIEPISLLLNMVIQRCIFDTITIHQLTGESSTRT
jgi:hypothetical protein